MKAPTLKGILAILGALLALILATIAALKDGTLSTEERATLKEKTSALIDTVAAETAESAQ